MDPTTRPLLDDLTGAGLRMAYRDARRKGDRDEAAAVQGEMQHRTLRGIALLLALLLAILILLAVLVLGLAAMTYLGRPY